MEHRTPVEDYCSIITELYEMTNSLDQIAYDSEESDALCETILSKIDILIIDNKLERDCPAVSYELFIFGYWIEIWKRLYIPQQLRR